MKKILYVAVAIVVIIIIAFFVTHKKTEAPAVEPIAEISATFENMTDFYLHFQALVAGDKVAEIAELVQYPLALPALAQEIKNSDEFTARYDELFTSALKVVIAEQDPYDFFERDQGIMIGNGEIWFFDYRATESDTHDYKIKTINVVQ